MSVLNRKLFNRGGKVSSRGVGITSGLVPVQKFQSGGSVSKLEALSPALLDLSGRLLAGTSPRGDFGSILGQALVGSSPLISQGLQTFRAGQEKGDRKIIKGADGFNYFADTGERVLPGIEKQPEIRITKPGEIVTKIEDGVAKQIFENIKATDTNKLYTLSTNQKLVDEDGKEIARGFENSTNSIFTLKKGQKAYDIDGNQIAFYPDDETPGEVIKLNKGQIAYDNAGNVIASNKDGNNQIIKLRPGESAFDAQGNVIASLPKEEVKKLEYFKLKKGEAIYDINGDIIAQAPSISEDVDKFHGGKTKDERLLIELAEYERKAGFNEDGTVNLDNLSPGERKEYLRILPLVDASAKEGQVQWEKYKIEKLGDLDFVTEIGEMTRLARDQFNQNPATGTVRGRLTPLFNVLLDTTGVNIPELVNDTFGKNILLEPLTADELIRLQSAIGVRFQEVMKRQVNTFEQQLI